MILLSRAFTSVLGLGLVVHPVLVLPNSSAVSSSAISTAPVNTLLTWTVVQQSAAGHVATGAWATCAKNIFFRCLKMFLLVKRKCTFKDKKRCFCYPSRLLFFVLIICRIGVS